MRFRPTPDQLIPDLSPPEELTLLARTLWREGYDDHLAGHITYRQPDGTLLTNPWYLLWEELTVEDIVEQLVIYGTPDKVGDELLAFRDEIGDFGTLLYAGMDWQDKALAKRSLQLLAETVMPAVNDAIKPSAAVA